MASRELTGRIRSISTPTGLEAMATNAQLPERDRLNSLGGHAGSPVKIAGNSASMSDPGALDTASDLPRSGC